MKTAHIYNNEDYIGLGFIVYAEPELNYFICYIQNRLIGLTDCVGYKTLASFIQCDEWDEEISRQERDFTPNSFTLSLTPID